MRGGNLPPSGAAAMAFHSLYERLYPDCFKPKLHLLAHVPECWLRFKTLLSCFATERKHKVFKRAAQYSYRSVSSTALAVEVRRWLKSVAEDENALSRVFLVDPVTPIASQVTLGEGLVAVIDAKSAGLRTQCGNMRKGDLLYWDHGCGFALGFVRATVGAVVGFAALVSPCCQDGVGSSWWSTDGVDASRHCFITSDQLLGALVYVRQGNKIRPRFPARM